MGSGEEWDKSTHFVAWSVLRDMPNTDNIGNRLVQIRFSVCSAAQSIRSTCYASVRLLSAEGLPSSSHQWCPSANERCHPCSW